jgi:hypothetical protein
MPNSQFSAVNQDIAKMIRGAQSGGFDPYEASAGVARYASTVGGRRRRKRTRRKKSRRSRR